MFSLANKNFSKALVGILFLILGIDFFSKAGWVGILVLLVLGVLSLLMLAMILLGVYINSLPAGPKKIRPAIFLNWVRTNWIPENLGEPPHLYWRIFLWACFFLAILHVLTKFQSSMLLTNNIFIKPSSSYLNEAFETIFFLPFHAAIVGAILSHLTSKASESKLARPIIAIPLALLAATFALLLILAVLRLFTLFAGDLDDPLGILLPNIFSLLYVALTLWIVALQYKPVGVGLKVFLAGSISGLLLSLILTYPVLAWVYNKYIPGVMLLGRVHEQAFQISLLSAGFVSLLIGPVLVWAAKPHTPLQKVVLGALAGGIAGGYVFGFLGGLSGVVAQASLLPIIMTREGFGGDTWIFRLVIATNNILPWIIAATWSLIGSGMVIGGLGALATPLRTSWKKSPFATWKQFLAELAWVGTLLYEVLTFIVVLVVYSLMVDILQNYLNTIGATPTISPATGFNLLISQHWVLILLIQTFCLLWIEKRWVPFSLQEGKIETIYPQAKASGYLFGLMGLLLIGLFYFISPSVFSRPTFQLFSLISIILSIETLLAMRQLSVGTHEKTEKSIIDSNTKSEFFEKNRWYGASLPIGFFVAILNVQFIFTSLSSVLIAVVLILPMQDVTTQPMGVEWLSQNSLLPFIQVTSTGFMALLLATMGMTLSVRDPLTKIPEQDKISDLEVEVPSKKKRIDLSLLWQKVGEIWEQPRTKYIFAAFLAVWGIFLTPSGSIPSAILLSISVFLFITDSLVRRLQSNVILVAYIIIFIGFVGLSRLNLDNSAWVSTILLLGLIIGLVIVYRFIIAYVPEKRRHTFRRIFMIGMSISYVAISAANQVKIQKSGGVSSFNNQSWTVFAEASGFEEALIGGKANYSLFQDSQNRLWYGSGTGAVIMNDNGQWNLYILESTSRTDPARSAISDQENLRAFLFEDNQTRIWVADGQIFGMLDPDYRTQTEMFDATETQTSTSLILPQNLGGETFALDEPLRDAVMSENGDIWLITGTNNAIQFTPGEEATQSAWTNWPFDDELLSVFAEREGRVWFGGRNGIYYLERDEIYNLISVRPGSSYSSVTLFEDSQGQMWIGTDLEGYYFQDKTLLPLSNMAGWPDSSKVTKFYEDSGENLWAGTTHGAYQLRGQNWIEIYPDVHVTALIEDQIQNTWIGTKEGLLRVPLSGESTLFSSTNSGLVDNRVRDLLVDREGNLWVSTFHQESLPRQFPWAEIGTALFFTIMFVVTRNGYEKSPDTQARRLGDQILQEPAMLLPSIYKKMSEDPENLQLLEPLGDYLENNQDLKGATISRQYAKVLMQSRPPALKLLANTLQADETREWTIPLSKLYIIASSLTDAKSAAEIAASDLMVVPFGETCAVSLHSPDRLEAPVPQFFEKQCIGTWRALENVVSTLKKYVQVDDVADRLGYLAQTLEALEKAQEQARNTPLPDGTILLSIADNWRSLVRTEIDRISGRANLRLELLTRQVRKADQVTISLRLRNSGRAAAENIRIALQSDKDFSVIGDQNIVIDRIPSAHSETIEFTLVPDEWNRIRVICELHWDDRVGQNHYFEFADIISFYSSQRDFQRIPNPYIVGHPLKTSELFQGREDIFSFIKENLADIVSDRTIVLYGQRRTGKTSVLYQLQSGRLGKGYIPVLIDMQEIAALVSNIADLLGEIAYQIARVARKSGLELQELQASALKDNPVRAFNRFIDYLEDVLAGQKVVLMFDEFELIEQKIIDGKIDPSLLDYFRSLMQHREHLVFIFTGTHRLEEMSHEYWSILFNIALYRRVSFLVTEEAKALIRQPVAGMLDIDDLVVEKILALTNGQPYFTQLICWALVEHCNNRQRNYATINDINDVLDEILATGKAHFAYIWNQAEIGERLALAGIAHTIKPGKTWARPDDILELLESHGVQIERHSLIAQLDGLTGKEVLELAPEGNLRYRFQIELLRLWIQKNQSIAALVERGL